MKRIIYQILLIPYLIASLAACGGSGGGSESIVSTQNNTSEQLSSTSASIETDFDTVNNELGSVTTYDESTGNQLINYFNNTMSPAIDNLLSEVEKLQTSEQELEGLITESGGTVNLVFDDGSFSPQSQIIVPLVAAGVILGGIFLAVGNFALNFEARVKKVDDAVNKSLSEGKTPAQAFEINSQLMNNEFNAHRVDLLTFISTNNKGVDYIKEAFGRGGKLILDLVDAANNALGIKENSHLIGRKKDNSTSNLIKYQTSSDFLSLSTLSVSSINFSAVTSTTAPLIGGLPIVDR